MYNPAPRPNIMNSPSLLGSASGKIRSKRHISEVTAVAKHTVLSSRRTGKAAPIARARKLTTTPPRYREVPGTAPLESEFTNAEAATVNRNSMFQPANGRSANVERRGIRANGTNRRAAKKNSCGLTPQIPVKYRYRGRLTRNRNTKDSIV